MTSIRLPHGVRLLHRGTLRLPLDVSGAVAPVEPVVDVRTASGRFRIAAPTQDSWVLAEAGWRPTDRAQVVTTMRSTAPARLLVVERGRPDRVVETLADLPDQLLSDTLAWIGWPRPDTSGGLPVTIQDRISARSNDYWILDVLLDALEPVLRSGELPPFPGVSVVIPARNVHDTLDETVDAIVDAARALPEGTPWECLVTDDLSEPPLALRSGTPHEVRILRAPERVYCGGGRNVGISQVRHPVVVFIDADTQMAPNYLLRHALHHLLAPNLITVSLREQLPPGTPRPDRAPDGSRDTRIEAHYEPGRLGLVPVGRPITVRALDQTRNFRDFGYGRHLGPADLAFMVKGNNFVVPDHTARIGCPPDFVGYGPEDGTYAAKAIARGSFVVPVLDTGVFHREHPPRSGSLAARDAELIPNLERQARHLRTPADGPWDVPDEEGEQIR
ncbi:glycosyltransferase [Nocardiopsis sp. NPDC050513]|uniref:glycosyltransferase n=1 Tax=Nocardiopsis sp. NPDC050513 TaxID=3364338 RepID=UPI0037B07AE0